MFFVDVHDLIEVKFPPFFGVGGGSTSPNDALVRKYVSLRLLESAGKVCDVEGDGNCLFRCLAVYLYGSEARHLEVRSAVAQQYVQNRARWENDGSLFDTQWTSQLCGTTSGTYEEYVKYISTSKKFGDTICINAFLKLYPNVSYMLWFTEVGENMGEGGNVFLRCQAAKVRDDNQNLHPLDDPSTLHLMLYARHFRLLRGLNGADVVSSSSVPRSDMPFLPYTNAGVEETKAPDEAAFVSETISDVLAGTVEVFARCGSRGGRPKHDTTRSVRLSDSARKDLETFHCKCGNATDVSSENLCHEVVSSGVAWAARMALWSGTPQEIASKCNEIIENALYATANEDYELRFFRVNHMPVCERMWKKIFAIPQSSWKRRLKLAIESAKRKAESGVVGGLASHENRYSTDRVGRGEGAAWKVAYTWLKHYGATSGDRMPLPFSSVSSSQGGIEANKAINIEEDGDEDEVEDGATAPLVEVESESEYGEEQRCQIRLPQLLLGEVYAEYKVFCSLQQEPLLSYAGFRTMWRSELPYIKCSVSKGTFSICQVGCNSGIVILPLVYLIPYSQQCADYAAKLKLVSNAADYADIRKGRDDHLGLQREQRMIYYEHRHAGMMYSDKCISIIIDAMDQSKTYLPVVMRRAKNDNVDFLKQKLMGVLVHGHGAYVYVLHPPVASGANFTLECIWRTLMKLDKKYKEEEVAWPKTLMLQLDNASDNKSYSILAFCSYLVERGVFGEIVLSYLMVGHTHEDIDQFFSVISQHFSSLGRGAVISFQDFQTEVVGSFKQDSLKRPQCVELVEANHDFTEWLKGNGAQEETVSGIKSFRSFTIRHQTSAELRLPDACYIKRGNFELAAICTVKEYMSSNESKIKPGEKQWREKGPLMMLKKHPLNASPALEKFKDLAKQSKPRKGEMTKPLPAAWIGKNCTEILQIIHEELLHWVNNASHGATQLQREQFTAMLARKAGNVDDLSAEVLSALPKWELPQGWSNSPVHVVSVVTDERVAIDASTMVLSEAPPSPEIIYKETTRRVVKKLKDWTEMQASVTVLPAIPRDSICFVQTVTDERGLEWWFGISQLDYPECAADDTNKNEAVRFQWMSVQWRKGCGKSLLVPPNTFEDVIIKPWFEPNKGRKKGEPKNRKVIEEQPRCAVALVGVTMTATNILTETTKKGIAALDCGFEYRDKMLTYKWVREAAAKAK